MTDKRETPQKTHFADDATLAHIGKLERDNARLRELLKRAHEEMRLIRMKDCPRVYDITLRIEMVAALAEQSPGEK